MNNALMFSKKSDNWATPKDFYNKLNEEFNFNFDPCPLNSDFNGLTINWKGNVFINPPYSNIRAFLEKGIEEVNNGNSNVCVFLIPSRTDTKWFHDLIYNKAEIRFIKGRLKFGEGKNSAPFPSMIVIFRKELEK
jgi:site-specific DNA-methyltransferase (adenine-specific)